MSIEQIVTRQNQWEIQLCDNAVGAYKTYLSFDNEELAQSVFSDFKFRLVQKAVIDVGIGGSV